MASIPHIPDRAVILAAGLGSRLRPLTAAIPKPLIPVHGVPILHNALSALAANGVRKATVVVGYRHDAIRAACGSRFAGIDVSYVESAVFAHTGSAYSLWLARDALADGDALLLEGDVLFEPSVLARLLASPPGDAAAVAPFVDGMTGSAVTLGRDHAIEAVLMNQTASSGAGAALFKTMNLFRFTADRLRHALLPALYDFVGKGAVTAYLEQVLADLIAGGLRLTAVECGDLRWFEIDSEADLRIAETIFAGAAQSARPGSAPAPHALQVAEG